MRVPKLDKIVLAGSFYALFENPNQTHDQNQIETDRTKDESSQPLLKAFCQCLLSPRLLCISEVFFLWFVCQVLLSLSVGNSPVQDSIV